MTRPDPHTPLSELDLMMIRAGGRSEADFERSIHRNNDLWRAFCAVLADGLYHIVMRLEAGAKRPMDISHHRLSDGSES